MKIKIYELLGLIKDGKAPYKIKYQDYKWIWTGDDYKTIKGVKECFLITGQEYTWVTEFLNDEVEIIEDEFIDIEELYDNSTEFNFSDRQTGMTKEDRRLLDSNFKELGNKINDLIKNQKKIIERLKDGK